MRWELKADEFVSNVAVYDCKHDLQDISPVNQRMGSYEKRMAKMEQEDGLAERQERAKINWMIDSLEFFMIEQAEKNKEFTEGIETNARDIVGVKEQLEDVQEVVENNTGVIKGIHDDHFNLETEVVLNADDIGRNQATINKNKGENEARIEALTEKMAAELAECDKKKEELATRVAELTADVASGAAKANKAKKEVEERAEVVQEDAASARGRI